LKEESLPVEEAFVSVDAGTGLLYELERSADSFFRSCHTRGDPDKLNEADQRIILRSGRQTEDRIRQRPGERFCNLHDER
jgi:hypothetical protein